MLNDKDNTSSNKSSGTNRFKRKGKGAVRAEQLNLVSGFGQAVLKDVESSDNTNSISFNGETYTGKSIVISNDRILEDTQVSPQNERQQKWLNEYTLRDIITSLKRKNSDKKVQNVAVIAYRNKQGKIVIMDGSRRRMSCYLAGFDLLVFLLDGDFDDQPELVKDFSETYNVHRKISLLERGAKYQEFFESQSEKGITLNQDGIAEHFSDTPSDVSIAMRAHVLPEEWKNSFPYPSEASRRNLHSLVKLYEGEQKKDKKDRIFGIEGLLEDALQNVMAKDIPERSKNGVYIEELESLINGEKAPKKGTDYRKFGDTSEVRVSQKANSFKLELKSFKNDEKGHKFLTELDALMKKFGIEQQ